MTWSYTPQGDILNVYDHTGSQVASVEGWDGSWSGVPDVVYETMAEEARKAAARGDLEYAAEVFADAIARDIRQGTP